MSRRKAIVVAAVVAALGIFSAGPALALTNYQRYDNCRKAGGSAKGCCLGAGGIWRPNHNGTATCFLNDGKNGSVQVWVDYSEASPDDSGPPPSPTPGPAGQTTGGNSGTASQP